MKFTRERLENIEDQNLASYGVRSKDSKGRKYFEQEPAYRTAFQRDRDRILHTTAFRRLEYKTQVFINYEGDYYRTRLTHTLEVTQIGRTIARALGANEDLIEAICLAHDLGHPPFGHSGETTLNELLKEHGGFDHNKQSLRIVTKLENRFQKFPGLNLTWEVREGIVKHETIYDISDASEYNPELRGNLEAQIANAADEIAYTAHDLDDGLRSGLISPEMLNGLKLWYMLIENLSLIGKQLNELDRHRIIRRLIGVTVSDLISTTNQTLLEKEIDSVESLQKLDFNVISLSKDMDISNRELKDFLYANLYKHPRVIRMQVKADKILTDLYKTYISQPSILPWHVQEWINNRGLERTVCDYIAGMTDRFATDEFTNIFDPSCKP